MYDYKYLLKTVTIIQSELSDVTMVMLRVVTPVRVGVFLINLLL